MSRIRQPNARTVAFATQPYGGDASASEGFIGDGYQRRRLPERLLEASHCVTTNYAGLAYGPDARAGYVPGGDGLGPQYGNWGGGGVRDVCV